MFVRRVGRADRPRLARSARPPTRPASTAGPRASALLNATFGNLPEVVIVVLAINAGLDDIARASIIGSVIGNILLILGLSLVVGGWKNGIQTFNERVAATNSSMLILGVAGLGCPTLFAALEHDSRLRRACSRAGRARRCVVVYGAYLVLQLPACPGCVRGRGRPGQRWSRRRGGRRAGGHGGRDRRRVGGAGRLDQAGGATRSACRGRSSGSSWCPFVGNVAEHFSAVRLAYRNRVDFAMGDRLRLGHPDRARGLGGGRVRRRC